MKQKTPILLSFYGLSNGKKNLFFGKLAYSPISDLSFRQYHWVKNFRTIIGLYRTRAIPFCKFEMVFDHGVVQGETDASGSFWCEVVMNEQQTRLLSITLTDSGEPVSLTEELYPNEIHRIEGHTIVISDLDDTLIHSFIRNKFLQLRTLLFTSVEKRKTVTDMSHLIKHFASTGANSFYLSNSEQNLYPMLYRFLMLNEFPPGPLFLKQYVRLKDLLLKRVMGKKPVHKLNTLARILELFPNKKYILIGDNTQHDLVIYLALAEKHPENVRHIIIRKVHEKAADALILREAEKKLKPYNIGLHYASSFPQDLPWNV